MNNGESECLNKPHILIVEDNPVAATVQKMLMTGLNCKVDIAVTGEAAIDLVKKIHYDLILMDLGLPGIDGIQACEAIKKHEQDTKKNTVPMVAVTANADPQQHLLCTQAGMNDVGLALRNLRPDAKI